MYLNIGSVEGYVKKIKNDNKHLVISSIDANKKVLIVLDEFCKGLKSEINNLISNDQIAFGTDVSSMENSAINGCNKIRFSSNIDLPYGTLLKFQALLIVIKCVIEKDGKFFPQIYLEEGLFADDSL